MDKREESKAYKEVLIILNELDMLKFLPEKLVSNMEKLQDDSWNFTFDKRKSFDEQKVLKTTAELLTAMYITFICNDEDEKSEIKNMFVKDNKLSSFFNSFKN